MFRRESLASCVRALAPLIEADWRECGSAHEAIPLEVDWTKYLDYELVGILHLLTARDGAFLVGYILNFVNPHILHSSTRWGLVDAYWLNPDYRGGGIGRAMFEANERLLRQAGAKVIQASERVALRHGLFARLGYKDEGTVWRKLL